MNTRIMAREPAATSVLAVAVPAFADTELKICVSSQHRPAVFYREGAAQTKLFAGIGTL